MKKPLRIGIIGCGAIGSSLAKIIKNECKGKAAVAKIFDIDGKKSFQLAKVLRYNTIIATDAGSLIKAVDLVIEATHMKCSFAIAQQALRASKDIMIMSVGGVVDKYDALSKLARKNNRRVFIPSGAIAGLDGVKAFAQDAIQKVTLTTTKPLATLTDIPYVKEKFGTIVGSQSDIVLFEGSASQAVTFFPQNINVAAALSLAGIGAEKTCVRIIASPTATRNIHEVEVLSEAGTLRARTENLPHPENPKTSFLAVLSAAAMLKKILEPVTIGS